jgi:hypothetical protein
MFGPPGPCLDETPSLKKGRRKIPGKKTLFLCEYLIDKLKDIEK